jgi:hypothetical protein
MGTLLYIFFFLLHASSRASLLVRKNYIYSLRKYSVVQKYLALGTETSDELTGYHRLGHHVLEYYQTLPGILTSKLLVLH